MNMSLQQENIQTPDLEQEQSAKDSPLEFQVIPIPSTSQLEKTCADKGKNCG